MCWESVQDIAKIFSYVGPTIAAFWAVYVYWSGARRERAKWAESLYSRFFENKELKEIREALDCDPGNPEVATLVTKESPEFTDYLNFFELVAYLEESKQLKARDVKACSSITSAASRSINRSWIILAGSQTDSST